MSVAPQKTTNKIIEGQEKPRVALLRQFIVVAAGRRPTNSDIAPCDWEMRPSFVEIVSPDCAMPRDPGRKNVLDTTKKSPVFLKTLFSCDYFIGAKNKAMFMKKKAVRSTSFPFPWPTTINHK